MKKIPDFYESGRPLKHCGKRRKCWLPAFSPFPKMCTALPKQIRIFNSCLLCHMQMLSILTCQKILLFGNELTISAITEVIYLKPKQILHHQNGIPLTYIVAQCPFSCTIFT